MFFFFKFVQILNDYWKTGSRSKSRILNNEGRKQKLLL